MRSNYILVRPKKTYQLDSNFEAGCSTEAVRGALIKQFAQILSKSLGGVSKRI